MESIQIDNLKRNPGKMASYFKRVGDTTITKEDIMVVVPSRFADKGLIEVTDVATTLAVYAIIDNNNNYAVANAPTMQTLTPYLIDNSTIEGQAYLVFKFNANSMFCSSNKCIASNKKLYPLFDVLFSKGKIPWYLGYEDLAKVFLTTSKYAGSDIGNNPLTYEIFTSMVSRHPKDKRKNLRLELTSSNMGKIRPTYVGLNDPYNSYDTTGARLIGSYFGDGITTSLVNPEKKTSRQTDLLRS